MIFFFFFLLSYLYLLVLYIFNKIIFSEPVCWNWTVKNKYKIRDTLIYWLKSSFKVLYHWCFIAVQMYIFQTKQYQSSITFPLLVQTTSAKLWRMNEIRMKEKKTNTLRVTKVLQSSHRGLTLLIEGKYKYGDLLHLVDKYNIANLKIEMANSEK